MRFDPKWRETFANVNKFPSGPHFAVIVWKTSTVFVPGDERSRTHPGHGYPAHTETHSHFEYFAFTDEKLWKEFLEALYQEKSGRTDVSAFHVDKVAKVQPQVQVTFNTENV